MTDKQMYGPSNNGYTIVQAIVNIELQLMAEGFSLEEIPEDSKEKRQMVKLVFKHFDNIALQRINTGRKVCPSNWNSFRQKVLKIFESTIRLVKYTTAFLNLRQTEDQLPSSFWHELTASWHEMKMVSEISDETPTAGVTEVLTLTRSTLEHYIMRKIWYDGLQVD